MKKIFCILLVTAVLICGCGKSGTVSSVSESALSQSNTGNLSFDCSSFLQKLMEDGWQHDSVETVLGKRDAYFNRYDVYFDQGISVKYSEITTYYPESIGYYTEPVGNIENILLNEKYDGEILNGISMKSTRDEIVRLLGTPQFTDDSLNLFGYKADDFYLFCVGENQIDEISIYPVFAEENQTAAIKQAEALCEENGYSRELAEQLAAEFAAQFQNCNYYYSLNLNDRWSSRAAKVGYASYTAGIEIQWDDKAKRPGPILYIYGNSDLLSSIKDAADITDQDGNVLIEYRLTEDLVFIQEQNRINEKAEAVQRAAQEGVVSPDGNVTLVDNHDYASPLLTGFNVLYKDGSKPDYTVLTNPVFGNAAWINDRYFLCNYSKNSLMIYDLQLRKSKTLSSCMNFCEILPDRITADNGTGNADVVILYSFDKDGSIILSCDNQSFYTDQPWTEADP